MGGSYLYYNTNTEECTICLMSEGTVPSIFYMHKMLKCEVAECAYGFVPDAALTGCEFQMPSPSPSPSPEPPTSSSGYECYGSDDTSWYIRSKPWKNCAFLSRKPQLCKRKSDWGQIGYEGCPYACGLCSGGEDSSSWTVSGSPDKDCTWVGKNADDRCSKKDDSRIEASYACSDSCPSSQCDR